MMVDVTKEFRMRANRIKRLARSSKITVAASKFGAKLIVDRTQARGKGLTRNTTRVGQADQRKLAVLKKSTIKKRQSFRRLSSKTYPKKSNLTFTGQLMKSIVGAGTEGKIVITVKDRRRRIGREKKVIGNRELIDILEKGRSNMRARPFFNLSKKEARQLEQFIRLRLRALLK